MPVGLIGVVDLQERNLTGALLCRCDLRGSDLSRCTLGRC